MEAIIILIIAVIGDFILGDPGGKYHPVALIGNVIYFMEKVFYKNESKNFNLFLRGTLAAITVLFLIGLLAYGFALITKGSLLGQVIQGILLSFTLSTKTLAKRGIEIADDLISNNLTIARKRLSYIVSRDTKSLTTEDVVRGTIETMAENFVDGIVAPLFWYLIFGFTGAFVYRAANTLDAMYGYRNEHYEYFGKFAAKLDDVLNYIPARIGGFILLLTGIFFGYRTSNAVNVWKTDAQKHPSPNSGIPESVIAGLLGIRLGGYNYYHGKKHFRAYLGQELQPFQATQIYQLKKILYTSTILCTIIFSLSLLINYGGKLWRF